MTLHNTAIMILAIEDLLEEGDLDGAVALGHSLAILCMTPKDFEDYVRRMFNCFDEQSCYTPAHRRDFEHRVSQMRRTRNDVCSASDRAHQATVREAMSVV